MLGEAGGTAERPISLDTLELDHNQAVPDRPAVSDHGFGGLGQACSYLLA